jgi:hypothetical protein
MKKILFPLLLLLFAFSAKAQWSSMRIINHSTCDYNVRLFATYDVFNACNYDNQIICVPAGASLGQPTYWDWACFNAFIPTPNIPDAPSTWVVPPMATPCGGVGTSATPWGSLTNEFDWRGALIWPCGTTPVPPGNNSGHPCGTTHYVGDGFCGPQNPIPPVHIWTEDPGTGNVTLDLY